MAEQCNKKAIHERDYYFRKAKQPGGENFWSSYKTKRNKVTCKIRQKKARYNKNLCQENQSSPQSLWKAIRNFLPNKKPCEQRPKSLQINSTITSDKREIANGFSAFFINFAATLQATLPKACKATLVKMACSRDSISPNVKRFVFRPVTKGEILKVLSSLKISKLPGPVNIPQGLYRMQHIPFSTSYICRY